MVVCVSEVSRLSVIVAAREFETFVPRFQNALQQVLEEIGIPAATIEKERKEMNDVAFAHTKNRSVLGTMNDFFFQLRWALKERPDFSPLDHALSLSRIPVGPYPHYRIPADETRAVMEFQGRTPI
jgi:hypothetical protein